MDSNSDSTKKINIDTNTLIVLYKHYKEFFLPVGVIVVSILLFFFAVIPAVQNYFNQQALAKDEAQKLLILKNNLNTLSGLDDTQLNQNITVLSSALPSTKDFAGVINAINADAALTGVSVGDFEFQVGNLTSTNDQGIGPYPTLQLAVSINGSVNSILQYMNEFAKTVPIAEVTSIKTNSNFANITILFYFKPFLSSNLSDETPVNPLSQKDQDLISKISKWNNSVSVSSIPTLLPNNSPGVNSSSSAGSNPSPF